MKTWDGGKLAGSGEQRLPVLAKTKEQEGRSDGIVVVSPEEKAESALSYKEVYAEMVRKAEADLALEEVPVSYREFLRRYFSAIRPREDSERGEGKEPNDK